ncbi:MAG TPA: hypothetical protein VFU60_18345 [Ktedonobacterales bacterium]|nr:hypothetical protein [Ktedonobacterales bacterium]
MLFDVGWLVLVWVIWTVLAAIVLWLVQVTMRGQQEIVNEQESAIAAWEQSHGLAASAGPDAAPHAPLSAS